MSNYSGNTLITLHNVAHTANHLLTVQLVNSPSAPSTKTNFKAQYFYFFTLAPGVGSGGSRTYDFTAKINMKFSINEVFAFSFILQQCAVGNSARVLPYSKFSKSSTGQKLVSVVENIKQSNNQNVRVITVFVGCDGKKYSVNLQPAEAYALSKQLDLSATDAAKMEFARLSSCPNIRKPVNRFDNNREMMAEPQQSMTYHMPPVQQQQQPVQQQQQPMQQQQENVGPIVTQFSDILNSRN